MWQVNWIIQEPNGAMSILHSLSLGVAGPLVDLVYVPHKTKAKAISSDVAFPIGFCSHLSKKHCIRFRVVGCGLVITASIFAKIHKRVILAV